MDYIKELEEIVKNDVLIEISQIKDSKKNKDLKEELKYMEQVKLYFDEVILDIENKTMTQEQALDILEGLEDMRADNQEV
jgi:hypothetical protein